MPLPEPTSHTDAEAIAVTRALGGSVDGLTLLRAHVDATGGEHRPQQEQMTLAVTDAVTEASCLLVQAGTGTGKSLAYLFPLAASGRRAVVATATNQLSEQLVGHDLPQVQATLAKSGQPFTFALLKGRNNYVCRAKLEELRRLDSAAPGDPDDSEPDALFELEPADQQTGRPSRADSAALTKAMAWAERTRTGDRSEAPPVPDRVWGQLSTSSADCPGASACPFGDTCFTERARAAARTASVVVTNHALLAQDLKGRYVGGQEDTSGPAGSLFGQHSVLVVDEAHDFPDALTSAMSSEVDPRSLAKFLTRAARQLDPAASDTGGAVARARAELDGLLAHIETLAPGPLIELPAQTSDLLAAMTTRLLTLHAALIDAVKKEQQVERVKRAAALGVLATQCEQIAAAVNAARTLAPGTVRWIERDRRDDTPVLRVAPILVGDLIGEAAAEGITLIATSATLTLGGDFSPILRTLGLEDGAATTLDVGSPFDYPKQGMLYVPDASFPEPVGRDRTAHTAAVLEALTRLVAAAGGRTLALFTTTAGAQNAAAHLRSQFPGLTVHAHGDAPADSLVRQFRDEETSVLCVTMGLWQGVSIEGPSCSLVVIDKVAFAPIDDVLTAARRATAQAEGRDGFTEVVVAQAATSLAQGVGRLIRRADDRGVAAILDPRLRTKSYGRVLLASLPEFPRYSSLDTVCAALTRLTGGLAPEATTAPARKKPPTTGGKSPARRAPRRASSTRAMGSKPLRPKRID